jgi:hypothetical protein
MTTIHKAMAWAALCCAPAAANTWIGQVSALHCTPEGKALQGDDARCLVFIANDRQVYTVENQDLLKPHIGHDVTITGTVNTEIVIGISYQTQGIIRIDEIKMLSPLPLSDEEQKQFQTLMKGMQAQVTAVRNVIIAKDKTPLAAESDKLAARFEEVRTFLDAHHSADGKQFAETARDAAKSIADAPTQVEQILALRKVTDTCAGCHLAHRAGKQGEYKIQP